MRSCQWASLCFGLASVLSGQVQQPTNQNTYAVRTLAAADVPPPLTVRAIAAGGTYSVALASDGTVWTWGENSEGQLGNGTYTAPPLPAEVNGLSGVVAISAGFAHTVALKSDGTVWAWGKNREGQVGDGTSIGRTKPVAVRGLSGIVAVAAGNSHSMALKDDGTVWVWGDNLWGQLGDGTMTNRATPAPVGGLTGVMAVAAGQAHSLALKRDGTVWAWGHNSQTWVPSTPAQIGGLTEVTAIAGGYYHSLALKADGTVWVWWWGTGEGIAADQLAPAQAGGLANVVAIAAGYGYSLAVKGDGTVWEWGCSAVESAYRTYTCRETPAQVTGLSGVNKVALPMGGTHGLALKGDGTAWEWGGSQGTPATMARSVPSQLGELSGVVAVSGGLALKSDGTVWRWDAPFTSGWIGRSMPAQVSGLNGVVAIASGTTGYNLALKNDETVWNVSGPWALYKVPNLTEAVAVAASESHALAVKRDGTVWEWSGVDSAPEQVRGLSDVAAVAVAFEWWDWSGDYSVIRSFALKRDGTVWAWDGAWYSRSAPVQVSGLAGITAIAAGEISLALKDDGTVWQWNEEATNRSAPVQVSGLTGITAIAAGQAMMSSIAHGLALRADGTVWGWGLNAYGQLGDGTTVSREAPVQVGVLSEVAAIAATGFSSAAVKRDGTVWAWGAGANQFGSTWSSPAKVPPLGSPDVAIAMSHSGDFVVGDLGAYSLAIANTGRTATSGVITLTDMLPPTVTFVSAIGNGWTCAVRDRIVTCTNPGPIAPGASSIVTLTVRVEPQAYPGVTNIATVSNASDFSTWNNTTGDPAVVVQR